ncbi:MAG: aminoglycoside phosphotransferase family protein [Acidimicrobiales bacterium]|jgi:aminoglycoside/choline kinase family phosphotransferase
MAETPGALTAAWLTTALRASGHLDSASVTTVGLTPLGTGQMCDCFRLALGYDRPVDAPATVVAKLPSADETSRATAKALGSYENEVRFYQQLAPELLVRTPTVFHADIDADGAGFVLLLEDLAPARQGDQLAGCTADVAKMAIDELVKLHAPRWDDPSLASLEWLHRDREASQQFLLMLLPGLWDGFRERYVADLGADIHEAGEALFAELEAYLLADTEPWSIVHGDYRLDNLLFDPSSGRVPGRAPVAVVDWQTCTHGPALQDVAYFIGAGLHAAERRAVEEDLVRGYHAGLVAGGVHGYDWARCWHDYRRGIWLGLIMAIAASMLVERTERGDQMFLTMAARHARHALDLDSPAVIRA